jgi:actin-related protein
MTANALTPKNHRESLVEMMFEIYNVPQFAVEVPGVLSFFSANKESGLCSE